MRSDTPSQTAEAVALMRALEQRRAPAERIVDDPLARHFLGPAMWGALAAWEKSGRLGDLLAHVSTGLTTFVQARHRHMDELLLAAMAQKKGRPRHVVILGAGYDTRGFRLGNSLDGATVVEIDHPATARRKERILEGLRRRGLVGPGPRRVMADLAVEELPQVLKAAGIRRRVKAFVVWEGVSMYLTRGAVEGTLGKLATYLGPGSELAMDCWCLPDEPDLRSRLRRFSASLLTLLGEPLLFSIHPRDMAPFLEKLGFDLVATALPADLARLYVKDERPIYPACFVVHARVRREGSRG